MRRAAAAALVTLAFGTLFAVEARRLEDPGVDAIGPGAFPFALGVVIAACGAALLVFALRGVVTRAEETGPARWGVLAAALALLLVYVHTLEWTGFALATAAFVPACLALLGARGALRLAVAGVAASLVASLVFGRLLGVDLPAGRLFTG